MKAVLRAALAQINVAVGDIDGNLSKIVSAVNKAREAKAGLIIFPELSLSGYPPEDLLLNREFLTVCNDSISRLNKHIARTDITAIIGFPLKKKSAIYNAAAVIGANDKKYSPYCKMHLPNYSVFDEKRYFIPGSKPLVYEIGGLRVGVNICEDIWIERGPIVAQKRAGANLIVNISASPFHAGKSRLRDDLVKNRATTNDIPILFTNLVGGQDELVFDGNSLVVDSMGKIIARGCSFKEDLVLVDIFDSRRGNLQLISANGESCAPLYGIEEIIEAILLGIKDYVRKNDFKKVVIGMSGGIDSAVAAVLATQALGKDFVTGVVMPSVYSSPETQNDAQIIARNLDIKCSVIPINEIYKSYLKSLKDEFKGLAEGVAEENIQARIRGNILMALANKFGWLVLSTGNKSEISVGYCTLYGDMAGGFSPLKDVFKTKIYEIARYLNKVENRELIPVSVIEREPSAELRPNQKDIDVLPPYRILDHVLQMYVENDVPAEEIIEKGYDKKIVEKVIKMVDRNEYKRRQSPPGIKITPRAFGKDRRFPITNRSKILK